MTLDIAKEWPVLVLVGGIVGFFVYVVVKSHQGERTRAEQRERKNGSTQ